MTHEIIPNDQVHHLGIPAHSFVPFDHAHLGLGTKGDAKSSCMEHRDVIGAVAHSDGLLDLAA